MNLDPGDVIARSPGDERLLRALARRGIASWITTTLVVVGLGAAVVLLYLAGLADAADDLPGPYTRLFLIVGLVILLGLFSFYALLQQRRVAVMARTLLAEHVRATTLVTQLSELNALLDTATAPELHLEMESVLETILQRLAPCLDADEVSVMLMDGVRHELRCVAATGTHGTRARADSVRVGLAIAGRVAEGREPAVIHAEDVGARFPGLRHAWRGVGSAVCMPLTLGDRVVGTLVVARLEGRPHLTDADATLLRPFADRLGATVHRIREFEALGRRASAFERMHLMRREFLCALNHELRTPLSSVIGYVQLLGDDTNALDEERRGKFLTALSDQAGRLLESVEELHGLYSLEASEATFRASPGSLNVLVQESVTAVGARAARQGIELGVTLDVHLPTVRLDQAKLSAAIRHLITGALRVSARDSRVTIETRREEHGDLGTWVVLEVRVARDSGVGLFGLNAVGAGESGAGRHSDALGWGVQLISELVELHGGYLLTDRPPEGGLGLLLKLPAFAFVGAARARAA